MTRKALSSDPMVVEGNIYEEKRMKVSRKRNMTGSKKERSRVFDVINVQDRHTEVAASLAH